MLDKPPAFTGVPLRPRGLSWRCPHGPLTPRRVRSCTVSARSLDSYREGNRFGNERRRAQSSKSSRLRPKGGTNDNAESPPKPRLPLVNALWKFNIASVETCAFLVRSRCVRVNGSVVNDAKAKVHRVDDTISVNGKEYGTVAAFEEQGEVVIPETSTEVIPRVRKDFMNNSKTGRNPEDFKKYNRRVDRGFFSTRRYNSGK